jgi:hypothetical protein
MHKSLSKMFLGSLVAMTVMAGAAAAQYQPIPNFTGIGAGFNFRQAINQRLSGAQSIAPQIVALTFATLPAEQDGLLLWCKDCHATSPCSAGGAGAWAMGSRGAWACAAGSLEQDLNASGHNIVAASSIQADQAGDAQSRELLVPGNGIKVGNGATAPFTVIDESANINGHVNGAINVKAPPYLAKGDGSTDDTAAIQAAVNASCAAVGSNKPEVYLPATPGGLCYRTSAPILLNCSLKFNGGGWQQTQICQNYLGPTIIAQGAETGWKPPLASSVTAAWTAAHSYAQYKELLDSNGNVEVQTASACTSGTGSHPIWPAAQGGTVSDHTCTWQLAMIGTQLASGSGSALDAVSPEMWPGAGFGSNNATAEIGNPGGPNDGYINGLSAFTVEFEFNSILPTSGGANFFMVGMEGGAPETSNQPALEMYLADGNGSCTHNCLNALVDIGTSRISLQASGSNANATPGITHHAAVTYDGTTARLFLDGVLIKSAGASGTWTVLPYESFMIADQGVQVYPGMQATQPLLPAYYDALRVSSIARYTSNFTSPTAKFATDGNTIFVLNYPNGTPTGTLEGYNQPSGKNVFIPIETSDGGADLNPLYIGNLSLGDNGIWATWMLNSTIENINIEGAGRTCINLADNDYQDTIRRVFCAVVPFPKTNVGFLFLNQSNNNLYDHLQCDGQYSCIGQGTGSGHYIVPDFTDRGFAVYPLYFVQAQALLDSPELDMEAAAPNNLAAVYSNGGYAPVVINGGQLSSGGTGNAYLAINGGAPFIVAGTQFSGGTPAELLNVIANPTSPVAVRDVVQPSGIALTNAGKSWWLNESAGSQDLGVKFADLPGSVTNGARRYCIDCDPPANPPVACTSSGAKTGAWINGLNNVWLCVP